VFSRPGGFLGVFLEILTWSVFRVNVGVAVD
jgi:hypothetical protein